MCIVEGGGWKTDTETEREVCIGGWERGWKTDIEREIEVCVWGVGVGLEDRH